MPSTLPEDATEEVSNFLPATSLIYRSANEDLARVRALRVVNALTGFAAEHGRESSGLGDLSLPAEAMVDPFSGKPLLLKKTAKGWVVSSVGAEGKDDGGDVKEQGADLGVRDGS